MTRDVCAKSLENEEQQEDKLSQLPDVLLVSILSLISYKEAARTSVLSSRWKKVWNFVSVISFDASSTLLYIEEQNDRMYEQDRREMVRIRAANCMDLLIEKARERDLRIEKVLMVERSKYINCVNGVLDSYQGMTIEEFTVCFDLDSDNSRDIQRWISFALERKVQRLVMDLRRCRISADRMKTYCFHTQTVELPKCNSLKVVRLRSVDVSGEGAHYLLSTCSSLEHLSIEHSNLVDLKIDTPLLSLKYLAITWCGNIKNIDIYAPNLLTFRCHVPESVKVSYAKIPNVTDLYIGVWNSRYICFENPSTLSNHFTQLETLTLNIFSSWWFYEENMKLVRFPELSHLKNINLNVEYLSGTVDDFLIFAPLIKSSPLLETFSLKLSGFGDCPGFGSTEGMWETKLPICPHNNLKFVEITGYMGTTDDNDFIVYLIQNAVLLEKAIIHPGQPGFSECRERHARKSAERLKYRFRHLGDKLLIL